MMTKTESVWVNPAGAYAMWVEVWTAWYVAALAFWMPLSLSGRGPVAGPDGGLSAKAGEPSAPAPVFNGGSGGEAGGVANKAANGSIAGQAVNGRCAW